MASPPTTSSAAPSPPATTTTPLALPRQRPRLALPIGAAPRRPPPPPTASATAPRHPLHQTSFPPQHDLRDSQAAALRHYSPIATAGADDDEDDELISDSEIVSAISGPVGDDDGTGTGPGAGGSGRRRSTAGSIVGKKRKRGTKASAGGARGRPVPRLSEDGQSRRGAGDDAEADDDDDEDDEDDDDDDGGDAPAGASGRLPTYEGGQLTGAEQEAEQRRKALFRRHMVRVDGLGAAHAARRGTTRADLGERYDAWNRARLRPGDVRRLVNHSLGQSVPANVVTVVSAATKMFAGLLVEAARDVQAEWMAVQPMRADGRPNPVFRRLQRAYGDGAAELDADLDRDADLDADADAEPLRLNGASGLRTSLAECDRGALTPAHLREALRRYQRARPGDNVGGAAGGGGGGVAGRRRLFR